MFSAAVNASPSIFTIGRLSNAGRKLLSFSSSIPPATSPDFSDCAVLRKTHDKNGVAVYNWRRRVMAQQKCIPKLKALADQTRWAIVGELLHKPRTVSELTERLHVSQYNVSKHLRILREA